MLCFWCCFRRSHGLIDVRDTHGVQSIISFSVAWLITDACPPSRLMHAHRRKALHVVCQLHRLVLQNQRRPCLSFSSCILMLTPRTDAPSLRACIEHTRSSYCFRFLGPVLSPYHAFQTVSLGCIPSVATTQQHPYHRPQHHGTTRGIFESW